MFAPYQLDSMVPALTHTADVNNAHGKKYKRLDPPGAFADSC